MSEDRFYTTASIGFWRYCHWNVYDRQRDNQIIAEFRYEEDARNFCAYGNQRPMYMRTFNEGGDSDDEA